MRRFILFTAAAIAGISCSAAPEPSQKGEVATAITAAPSSTTTGLAFKTCAEAKAAGYQDIKEGSPRYSTKLDGNSDGVACEVEKPKARVGSAAVYEEIAAETDCSELQATFDRAETTSKRDGGPPKSEAFPQEKYGTWSEIGIAYMKATDNQMQDVGCY